MNESENKGKIKLSTETEELINSTTSKDLERVEKTDKLQKEHAKEIEKWRETVDKVEDKVIAANKETEEVKNRLLQEQNEKKALAEALRQQKQKYSTLTEPEERLSYGDKISKGAYDLILKRCKMGYYGGKPCQECKISLRQ